MQPTLTTLDKKIVRKIKRGQLTNDFSFWKNQSYEFRLATLEQIRNEYNKWKYDTDQGFQRVYTVIKRT
jgi:hypothetical protein